MSVINQDILDKLAQLEVDALLKGLNDQKLRNNPSFLEKVRKFLKDNKLVTTPETPGVSKIRNKTSEIPVFDDEPSFEVQ